MAERSEAAAKWAGRVARLGKSGLSLKEFAAREGLKARSLSFWKVRRTGTDHIGHKVDLVTPDTRKPRMRPVVERKTVSVA